MTFFWCIGRALTETFDGVGPGTLDRFAFDVIYFRLPADQFDTSGQLAK